MNCASETKELRIEQQINHFNPKIRDKTDAWLPPPPPTIPSKLFSPLLIGGKIGLALSYKRDEPPISFGV